MDLEVTETGDFAPLPTDDEIDTDPDVSTDVDNTPPRRARWQRRQHHQHRPQRWQNRRDRVGRRQPGRIEGRRLNRQQRRQNRWQRRQQMLCERIEEAGCTLPPRLASMCEDDQEAETDQDAPVIL